MLARGDSVRGDRDSGDRDSVRDSGDRGRGVRDSGDRGRGDRDSVRDSVRGSGVRGRGDRDRSRSRDRTSATQQINVFESIFNERPFQASITRKGQVQFNKRLLITHIPTSHSGKIVKLNIESRVNEFETFEIAKIPYIVYQLSKLSTVGVIPPQVANNIVTEFLRLLDSINTKRHADQLYNHEDYINLCHELNIFCENEIRTISMPDIAIDTNDEIESLTVKYNEMYHDENRTVYSHDDFAEHIKGINETIRARLSFAKNHRSFGELKLYLPKSRKHNNLFINDNVHRDSEQDNNGNIRDINWYNPLFYMDQIPTSKLGTTQGTATRLQKATRLQNAESMAGLHKYKNHPFLNALDLSTSLCPSRTTRSGMAQTGYKESELYELLSTQQKTMIFTINVACQVLLTVDENGCFEEEIINQPDVARILRRERREQLNTIYDNTVDTGIVIPLSESYLRMRGARSIDTLDRENVAAMRVVLFDLDRLRTEAVKIDTLFNYDNNINLLQNLVMNPGDAYGGSKSKSRKSKKFQRRSKRRNNRRTYKKKARKTKRRRRY